MPDTVDEKVERIRAIMAENLKGFVGRRTNAVLRAHLELATRQLIAEQDLKPAGKFEIDVQVDGDIANIVPLNWYSAILMFSARVGRLVYPTVQQLREAEKTSKFEWDGFTLTRTDDGWETTLPPPANHIDIDIEDLTL